jgi:hypothetical protein
MSTVPLALILHWAVGIPALLMLFVPIDALLPAGAQQRSYEQILASRSEVGLRPWRWHLLWMLEPVRAFVAAWLFQEVLGAWLLVLPLFARALFQCRLVLPSRY